MDQGDVTMRLAKRMIHRLRSVGDEVLVNFDGRDDGKPCELLSGEQVVVSPLPQAVVGMKVRIRNSQLAATSISTFRLTSALASVTQPIVRIATGG